MTRAITLSFLLLIVSHFFTTKAEAATGLTYTTSYCGSSWPCSMTASALSTGTLSTGDVNLNWGSGAVLDSGRSDYVVVKLEGYFVMPGTLGTSYLVTFTNQDDDGSRTIIGGTTVVDDWSGLHAPADRSGSITLVGGTTYSYVRWQSEWGGGAVLRQFWKIGSGTTTYMNFADDFTTTSGPSTSTTTGTSGGITSTQSTSKSGARTRANSYGSGDNTIYIDQAGNNNTIEILQDGTAGNHVRGVDGADASTINGNSNTIDIRQGADTSTGINLIEFSILGSTNDILLYQDRLDAGSEASLAGGDHTIRLDLDGSLNDIDIIQRNNYSTNGGHFVELEVTGDSNVVDLKQIGDYSKDIFGKVTGDSNDILVRQRGASNKYLEFDLIGNGHSVDLTQQGLGNHDASISLTYGSASSSVTLDQNSSLDQSYSLEQTCYTIGGCSATVTQN